MNLNEFLDQLRSADEDEGVVELCRRNVLHGTPQIFRNKEDEFYTFRKRIADKFGISFYEIYIVGSAKLGFSPFKKKAFDFDSDIDVAIVSGNLYEHILESVRQYQMEIRRSRRAVMDREMKMYHEFLEYTAIGWVRPDKLPLSFKMSELKDGWFEFFKSISNGRSEVGNYKVSAGVYKNYRCLELYTISSLRDLRKSLTVGG